MHLKSLTLRGFKSFASATTLRFEPGITCVVGPNGSGKSNVVDALTWVMGEQGAKSLRGGSMEDVIFAGTSGRAPLGRAEVVLTIDNADGCLPVEGAQVTISRTMFRSGGSDYAINGERCRLLDVQELLSDSGIGREMHVVVGQGRLEAVLTATPEDRRGFVEEAAGVLKHRKRKEKALRKLEAMQANLARLQDLTAELNRQLKPLSRQAEVARGAAVVQAAVRDTRLRLLADDLVQLRAVLAQEVADESAVRERQASAAAALAAARQAESAHEEELRLAAAAQGRAQETWYRLGGVRERLLGTAGLAAERVRHLRVDPEEPRPGRDPAELDAEVETVRGEEAALAAEVARRRDRLSAAEAERERAERAQAAEEQRLAALVRAAADRRAGLARLAGQVEGLRRRAAAAEAEIGRLQAARSEAMDRADAAEREFAALESTIGGLSAGEDDLDADHSAAQAQLSEAVAEVDRLHADEQDAQRQRSALAARVDALRMSLARKDGSGALLAAGDRLSGLLGSVAAVVQVRAGAEAAIAAALGRAADAVAVADVRSAAAALAYLRAGDLGRAGLLVGAPSSLPPGPLVPAGLTAATDLVDAPPEVLAGLRRLLAGVVVVDDLDSAVATLAAHPGLTMATRDGDLLAAGVAHGGSASTPSLLEVQAAVDEAGDRLAEAARRCERLTFALAQAQAHRAAAHDLVQAALARLHESDARLAAVADQLGRLGQTVRAARAEAERGARALAEAERGRDADLAGLGEQEQRLAAAEAATGDRADPSPLERDRLAELAVVARRREVETRLALRTVEERARALAGRADTLERAARQERAERVRAERRRERRAVQAAAAAAVALACRTVLERLEASLAEAARGRAAGEQRRVEVQDALTLVRQQARVLGEEVAELTTSVHRDEVARAEQRLRVEQVEARAREELGIDPEALVEDYGPHLPVPAPPALDGEPQPDPVPPPGPYVRAELERRRRVAERALARLGRINPLALEEYDALQERHRFLVEQLEDIRATRRDLLEIVREVDERVESVFAAAYLDTAREFEAVFARLFPGGAGRLVLTDPGDLLATGIEVEARPPGKVVKRLSLLSGGERSLVAVAFLVALFKARPSPFYVLDEVEAALDDTNLGRLLEIYEELREASQLIVVTHQKRTMEVADALYGVSMRGDGVTTVISQRLREPELA